VALKGKGDRSLRSALVNWGSEKKRETPLGEGMSSSRDGLPEPNVSEKFARFRGEISEENCCHRRPGWTIEQEEREASSELSSIHKCRGGS